MKCVHQPREPACALATSTCLKQSSNENLLVQHATSIRGHSSTKTCLCIHHRHSVNTLQTICSSFCRKHMSDTFFKHKLACAIVTSACVKYLASGTARRGTSHFDLNLAQRNKRLPTLGIKRPSWNGRALQGEATHMSSLTRLSFSKFTSWMHA